MLFRTKSRFAVMALSYIVRNNSKKPISLAEISRVHNIDLGYLEQIFLMLKKEGVVKSFRGALGGYKLATEPNKVKLSTILEAVDEDFTFTRCKEHIGCMADKSECITHKLWVDLGKKMRAYFEAITLEDINKNNYLISKDI